MKKKNFKRFMAAAMSAVCLVTGTGGGYLAQAKEISDPTGLLEEEQEKNSDEKNDVQEYVVVAKNEKGQ